MAEILTTGDFRAYTLKPHWAHAIAHLGKRCENRTRPIPKGLVGKRVAIHAGAWSGIERVAWLDELDAAFPGTKAERLERCGGSLIPIVGELFCDSGQVRWRSDPDIMHCSAFIATAVIQASIKWEDEGGDAFEQSRPDWTRWGDRSWVWWWRLTDVRTLRCPVPVARGAQGPWRLTQDQVDAINAQGGGLEVPRG